MAKVLFEDMVKKALINSLSSLFHKGGKRGINVDSAGTSPVYSSSTQEAIEVMREYGLDLTTHRSKEIDASLVAWADLILVMENWHKQRTISRYPEAMGKTFVLSEYVDEIGDVSDPYGGDIREYRSCASRLQELLVKVIAKLNPQIRGDNA